MPYLGNTPTTQSFISGTDYFSGNGSTTAFTLSRTVNSVNDIEVFVNNVAQQPNDAYTLSGTTLTFTSTPSSGTNNIYVRYLSTTTQSIGPWAINGSNVYYSSGNVGIGTSSPVGKVDISGLNDTGGVTALIRNTSDIGNTTPFIDLRFSQRSNGADNGRIRSGRDGIYSATASTMDSFMAFYTAIDNTDTERMRITSSGEVCVGTTATQNISGVVTDNVFVGTTGTSRWACGFVNNSASTPYGITVKYGGSSPNNTGGQAIYFVDSTPAVRFEVRSNGGIANYSANDVNLSDEREKTNIQLAGSYLDKICAISVKTFNYIDQNREEDDGLTLGVIAQDVQKVAPELVMESDWGTKEEPKMRLSIYQTDLQYALMKCIQEQQAMIEELKARIETLEAK